MKDSARHFLIRGGYMDVIGHENVFDVRDLPMDRLHAMEQPATLADLPALGAAIVKGQVRGRVVVDVNA